MKILIVHDNTQKASRIAASLPPGAVFDCAEGTVRGISLYVKAKRNNEPYDLIISGLDEFLHRFRTVESKINGTGAIPVRIIYAAERNGFRSILEAYEKGANAFMGPDFSRSVVNKTLVMVNS